MHKYRVMFKNGAEIKVLAESIEIKRFKTGKIESIRMTGMPITQEYPLFYDLDEILAVTVFENVGAKEAL